MIFGNNFGKCPICEKHRSTGNHRKCSKILQRQRDDNHWDTVHTNQRKEEIKARGIECSYFKDKRANHLEFYG